MRHVASLADLSLSLRPAIRAPRGKKVVLSDFKSVENRVLFWLANCKAGMDLYASGMDPYIDFAAKIADLPYEEISKEQRQVAKPGVLGCGFGLGGGKETRWGKCSPFGECKHVQQVPLDHPEGKFECPKCHAPDSFKVGPKIKSGLWRYAEMMGIEMSQDEAAKQVAVFRDAFTEVCELWYWLEEAYIACAQTKRPQKVGCLSFVYRDPALRIVLPSGRELVYVTPFASRGRDDRGFKSISMGFYGVKGKSWVLQTTYGGRLCENVVQAIAYDLLVDAMFLADADPDLEIVGHTHDEIICEAWISDTTAKKRLEVYMSQTPAWAPGLIMAADGFEGERYSKG